MPTSETGPPNKSPLAAAAGFTLIEIMVVMAIIALMVVLVRFTLPDRADQALTSEAERFVQALQDCRDTAVLSGAPAGIRISTSSYAMQSYRRTWQPTNSREANKRAADGQRVLPRDLALAVARDRRIAPDDRDDGPPDVICMPSGEHSLPLVQMTHSQSAGYYEFRADDDGEFIAHWVAPPA